MNPRRRRPRLVAFVAIVALAWVVRGAGAAEPFAAPLLLIGLDGFRWDYLSRHPAETPRLRELARTGASARALIPVFPSNTFANHYTLVTGLYPARHGIINNRFFDPGLGRRFEHNVPLLARQPDWWGGEPIWNTAVRQGRASATSFWPGSEAEIGGRRPTYRRPFDLNAPFAERLEELIGWLRLPPERRPAVVTFYFEPANSVGHAKGPDSPELAATVRLLDTQIGVMVDRLRSERLETNVVIVSDHGMTPVALERVVLLDDFVDLAKVQVDFEESVMGLRPHDGDVDGLLRALSRLPERYRVYRASDLPARFRLRDNPRIPPVWIVPDEGWEIFRRAALDAVRANFHRGQHGYDPAYPSMHGILIVHGPAFRSDGFVADAVENVHVYRLLCAASGLVPAPDDGDDRLVQALLQGGGGFLR